MKRFAAMPWSDVFQLSGIISILLLAALTLFAPGEWVHALTTVLLPASLVVFFVGFLVASRLMKFSPFPLQQGGSAEPIFPQSTQIGQMVLDREVFMLHQELDNPDFMTWCKQGYRTDI